jgi:hypothetical protein
MKERTSEDCGDSSTGIAFALSARMHDRRKGPADRRASKRGGRRTTDAMRSDVDALRVEWEDLGGSAGSHDMPGPESDDEMIAGHAELGPANRHLFPPRK